MKILILGGAGFVGSRLSTILADPNAMKYRRGDVTVFDTFWFWNKDRSLFTDVVNWQNFPIKTILGDIRDNLDKVIRNHDVVINLACLSNDPSSDIDYNFTHDINYNGVANVVETCARLNKRLIHISSTSVYGFKQGVMMDELGIPNPITQYSKLKLEIDHLLKFYKNKPFTSLRPATLYGYSPRLRLDIMVNSFLERVVTDNKLLIQGGQQFRPCLHVEDLCNTIAVILNDSITFNKIYNVTNENYSVDEVAKIIQKKFPDVELHYQGVNDERSYKVSSKLIKEEVGVRFNHNLKKSIAPLFNGIKNHKDKSNCLNINVIKGVICD